MSFPSPPLPPRAEIQPCLPQNGYGGCHANSLAITIPGLTEPWVTTSCTHKGPGKHKCSCEKGFEGNGTYCAVVNPCIENMVVQTFPLEKRLGGCHQDATCTFKSPGEHKCKCQGTKAGNGTWDGGLGW